MLVIARRVGEAITAPGSRPKMPLQLGQVPGTAQILPEAPSGAQADQKTLDIAQGNTKVSLPTSEVRTVLSHANVRDIYVHCMASALRQRPCQLTRKFLIASRFRLQ